MFHYELFHSSLNFCQGTFQLFFVLVSFEDDVKITSQIETTFFSQTMNLRKNVGIYLLKYVFVAWQVVSQFYVVVLVLVQKISYYFKHFCLEYIFTVQIQISFFRFKYACKIFVAYILSKACRSFCAHFCLLILYPVRMDLDVWLQGSKIKFSW